LSVRAPERGILPIALPIALLAMIASTAFLFSRVLLNVHRDVAVAVALMTAFGLLMFFSFMSSRVDKANAVEKVMALGCLLLPIALGAAVALRIIPTKAEGGKEGETGPPVVNLAAKDLKFDKAEIDLVAGVENTINLDNLDTQPHNIVVFAGADASAPPLDDGQPIANPAQKVTYKVKAPGPGTYFFHCAIHPAQMTGKVVVKEGAAGGKEAGGGESLALTANNLAFDKTDLTAKADSDVTLAFTSKEAQPHNVQIFGGPDTTGPPSVLDGQPLMAPGKTTYKFKAPPAPGKYAFHCMFHPATMKGTLTVQ
jgi:plastocyanin